MRISEFDYELPEERIAQHPVEPRDAARLLVYDRASGRVEHRTVADLPELLARGDLLVVNDTRVVPARLLGRRASGGRVELLVVAALGPRRCRAMVRPASRLRAGERIEIDEGALVAVARERSRGADGRPGAEWTFDLESPLRAESSLHDLLERSGRVPLPPYIRRDASRPAGDDPDRERYQTVFARERGAVAAPTAGLHFTPSLLARLAARGVDRASLTLHVGPGTFQPLAGEELEEHAMHAEEFVLPGSCAAAVEEARARGSRVVAVGTTSVRVLESRADERGLVSAGSGETSLFVRPGFRFRAVDALLTNFHLPRSTLLVLVCAFAGREQVLELYREAIERGYRFYSYGDAMLVL